VGLLLLIVSPEKKKTKQEGKPVERVWGELSRRMNMQRVKADHGRKVPLSFATASWLQSQAEEREKRKRAV